MQRQKREGKEEMKRKNTNIKRNQIVKKGGEEKARDGESKRY